MVTPKIGVGAVIRNGSGQVLLIERGHDPEKNRWAVPGGHLQGGEPLIKAVEREVREELGVGILVSDLLYIAELIGDSYHFVVLDYGAVLEPGEIPRALSDAARWAWMDQGEIGRRPLANGMASLLADSAVRRYLDWE